MSAWQKKFFARERIWKSVTLVLASILFFLIFAPKMTFLQLYVNWFNSQSAWTQGIVITLVGIIIERLISLLISWIANITRKDKKKLAN